MEQAAASAPPSPASAQTDEVDPVLIDWLARRWTQWEDRLAEENKKVEEFARKRNWDLTAPILKPLDDAMQE